MAQELNKLELSHTLARARAQISASAAVLRRELDVPVRIRRKFQQHRAAWLGGVGVIGFLLTQFPRGRKKVVPKTWGNKKTRPEDKVIRTGLLMTVLKIAFDTARPALMRWLTQRVTDYATRRTRAR